PGRGPPRGRSSADLAPRDAAAGARRRGRPRAAGGDPRRVGRLSGGRDEGRGTRELPATSLPPPSAVLPPFPRPRPGGGAGRKGRPRPRSPGCGRGAVRPHHEALTTLAGITGAGPDRRGGVAP